MFCHECGHELSEKVVFCVRCGTRKKIVAKLDTETMVFILEKQHGISLSLRTLKRRLSQYGLKKSNDNYEQVSQIISVEIEGPSSQIGYRSMWNKLRTTYGINVPRDAVMKILRELDPEGCKKRKRRKLDRRTYYSAGPNTAWHTDGYDKLKPYGLPIHGCVDGFSRKILWVNVVKTNNNPVVPANFYLRTVAELGMCPALLRTDCGTENGLMAAIQCAFIDDIDAHAYGSSHSNQRIENWWSHFRRGYSNWMINFFKELVQSGKLILGHPVHMECVWFVFSNFLQRELNMVKEEWNNHYIRRSNFTEVSGVPYELFHVSEIQGYHDQGLEVTQDDINRIIDQRDIYKEAEEALNVNDKDLVDYFRHVITVDNFEHPPDDWKSAKDMFIHIVDRAGC